MRLRDDPEAMKKYKHEKYLLQKAMYTARNIRRRKMIKEFINAQKNQPCADCRVQYPPYVMDFDHVRGEKLFNVSAAPAIVPNLDKIREEIAKCDLVCSNCHRIRTYSV
jgi:hypothetical protein